MDDTLFIQEVQHFAKKLWQMSQKKRTLCDKRLAKKLHAMMQSALLCRTYKQELCAQSLSHSSRQRVAHQIHYLSPKRGLPPYMSLLKRIGLAISMQSGRLKDPLCAHFVQGALKKQMTQIVFFQDTARLAKHMKKMKRLGVRLDCSLLNGEALGEQDAQERIQIYADYIKNMPVSCISIKISHLYSQIQALALDDTLHVLCQRLHKLFALAAGQGKSVMLDMEGYEHFFVTVQAFKRTLELPDMGGVQAGIVLQSYLSDSYRHLRDLTLWAKERVERGGLPIKVRLVKGAYLALEQKIASQKGWQTATYSSKTEVDANYKRMLQFALLPQNAPFVKIGLASHNIFDIAYAHIVGQKNGVEKQVEFEMLCGMAGPLQAALQAMGFDVRLYTAVAGPHNFQQAAAYFFRQVEEVAQQESFSHLLLKSKNKEEWDKHCQSFAAAHLLVKDLPDEPSRQTSRPLQKMRLLSLSQPFCHEPDTNWSLESSRELAKQVVEKWSKGTLTSPSLQIAGSDTFCTPVWQAAYDPSFPNKILYRFPLATKEMIQSALACAQDAQKKWQAVEPKKRGQMLLKAARIVRQHRKDFLGALMADAGKTIQEADSEVSQVVDFFQYYARFFEKVEGERHIAVVAKGVVAVITPWNFPCAIPAAGLAAALMAGNCVLLKPSLHTPYIAWQLANVLWQAGVPREVLQFLPCEDALAQELLADKRCSAAVVSGSLQTVKKIRQTFPQLHLLGEGGGINSFCITRMADLDLAVRHVVRSAFSYSGQKCSSISLALIEAQVYDDPSFLKKLQDAAQSLPVGTSWSAKTVVGPLIAPPCATLLRALTTLDDGEEWLVEPKACETNAQIWSPGIKLGVKRGGFFHQSECLGPVLGLIRVESIQQAIEIANDTSYGPVAGLHSLDENEQRYWQDRMLAPNLFINCPTTDAIVGRQPFGGYKPGNSGPGAKIGGPHYIEQFMQIKEKGMPLKQGGTLGPALDRLHDLLKTYPLQEKDHLFFESAIDSYTQAHDRLLQKVATCNAFGKPHFFTCLPLSRLCYRLDAKDSLVQAACILAMCLICGCEWTLSAAKDAALLPFFKKAQTFASNFSLEIQSEESFLKMLACGRFSRLRYLQRVGKEMAKAAAKGDCHIAKAPLFATGRLEILHYVRELCVTLDYQYCGNLEAREKTVCMDSNT